MSASDSHSEGRASARPIIQRTGGSNSIQRDEDAGRHHPIHLSPLAAHNRPVIIFVTTCTAKRRPILATPAAHEAIVGAWRAATTWLVGRYVVMPDHVHVFCAPNDINAPSLERWMRFWKSLATRNMGEKSGAVWQRDHWDRQLRRGESYDRKWDYVCANPMRHGYVSRADDWPYQGELNELRW